VNKFLHQTFGSPGRAAKDPLIGLPANEVAAAFNDIRKTACPNPS